MNCHGEFRSTNSIVFSLCTIADRILHLSIPLNEPYELGVNRMLIAPWSPIQRAGTSSLSGKNEAP